MPAPQLMLSYIILTYLNNATLNAWRKCSDALVV